LDGIDTQLVHRMGLAVILTKRMVKNYTKWMTIEGRHYRWMLEEVGMMVAGGSAGI